MRLLRTWRSPGTPSSPACACCPSLEAFFGRQVRLLQGQAPLSLLDHFGRPGNLVKSICSFSPRPAQAAQARGRPLPLRTVRFFHGLSGLENACDNGQVKRNQNVFFNGASFLMDPTKGDSEGRLPRPRQARRPGHHVRQPVSGPGGDLPLQRRYLCPGDRLLRHVFGVPHPSRLAEARHFPLGFAYGHVPGYSVSSFFMRGRGFASQQIVEEFQARAELSGKVQRSIQQESTRRSPSASPSLGWSACCTDPTSCTKESSC